MTNKQSKEVQEASAKTLGSPGFRFTQPSLTIPGQVLSLRTILTRFRKGQGVQVFEGVYNPEYPPEYDKLDKIERIEAAREMANTVNRMRQKLSQDAVSPIQDTKNVVDTTEDKKDAEG